MKISEFIFGLIVDRLSEKDTKRLIVRQIEKFKLDQYEPDHTIENMLEFVSDMQESFNHGYSQMKDTTFSSDNDRKIPIESYLHNVNGKNIRWKDIRRVWDVLIELYGNHTKKVTPPQLERNSQVEPPQSTTKVKNQRKPKQVINDLEKYFTEKQGDNEQYLALMEKLYKQEFLSDDKKVWTGKKGRLASIIKFVGLKHFQKSFSTIEVLEIARNNFGRTDISKETAKRAMAENGEF